MTIADREETSLAERRVCGSCIRESYLSARIDASEQKRVCDYCDAKVATMTVAELGDYVQRALSDHFERTGAEPEGYDWYLQKEGIDWERPGLPVGELIEELLEAEPEIAEDVREFLDERTSDFDGIKCGEEQPFEDGAHYLETSRVDDSRLSENYGQFERHVTEEARFLSPSSRQTLSGLFAPLEGLRTAAGKSVLIHVGPGLPIASLFRARVFQDDDLLKRALAFPDLELGPPPPRRGCPGRLNAAGVSVFYGTDEPFIALAEVRPPVGSRVVLARFEMLRQLRILDLDALQSALVFGSLFDPEHLGRLQHVAFLRRFSADFTRAVMPDHETLEYIPTQAIADYLANETDPPLDGIRYRSAQAGGDGANVALFHKASRVELLKAPEGMTRQVWFGHAGDEEDEHDYSVFELLPKVAENPPAPPVRSILATTDPWDPPVDSDARLPALRIDPQSLRVHHISAVVLRSEEFGVRRTRIQKAEPDF